MPRSYCLLAPTLAAAFAVADVSAQSYVWRDTFTAPDSTGIAIDGGGNLYVTNYLRHTITRFAPNGAPTLIAGSGQRSSTDGVGLSAGFNYPQGLALDNSGNLFVADSGNHTIRKITPAGAVTTFAGAAGIQLIGPAGAPGLGDGVGSSARFSSPGALAVDRDGNVFVADTDAHTIRKITSTGIVSTLAGAPLVAGSADGPAASARFNRPQGLALDNAGNLYVADTGNSTIRRIAPGGTVTTVAGFPGVPGWSDGAGRIAKFNAPTGVTVDARGRILVADSNNGVIRRIGTDGIVVTLSTLNRSSQFARVVAVDAAGAIYSGGVSGISRGDPSSDIVFTLQPQDSRPALGGWFNFAATAIGPDGISYQWMKNGAPIPGATSPTLGFVRVAPGDAGTYAVVASSGTAQVTSTTATLSALPTLANNDFADPQRLTGPTGTINGTNLGATLEPGEPAHNPRPSASSVWYRWTAEQTGSVALRIPDGYFAPNAHAVFAYAGTALASLASIGQATGPGTLKFTAVAGTEYRIAVENITDYSAGGSFTLTWSTVPNDNFAAATILRGDSGQVEGSNLGATGEIGEPIHQYLSPAASSVWYRWTPSQTGVASLGSSSATLYAYTGAAVDRLSAVTPQFRRGTNGQLDFVVSANTTYSLAIDSGAAGGGPFTLGWQLSTQPVLLAGPGFGEAGSHTTQIQQTVRTGDSVTISAGNILSATPVTYQWRLNGSPIAGATQSTLAIAHARATEAGNYSVTVTNSAGSSTSSAVGLVVAVAPANDNPTTAETISGATGSKSVQNGYTRWYRWTAPAGGMVSIRFGDSASGNVYNEANLSSPIASGSTPVVERLGRYYVFDRPAEFTAAAGRTYYLEVSGSFFSWNLTSLAISQQPYGTAVSPGSAVAFSVGAIGAGIFYQWSRDGVTIPGATRERLEIPAVAFGDDAVFTVTVSNASGQISSQPARLTVIPPSAPTASFGPLSFLNNRTGGGLLWGIAANADRLVAVGDGGIILVSSNQGDS